MGNFDYLKQHSIYNSFSAVCIEAEQSFQLSYDTAAILCRKALELAVKWLYAHDQDLSMPYDNTLSALIHDYRFKNLIDMSHFQGVKYIKDLGNKAVHSTKSVEKIQAVSSIKALHRFISWIDYSYSPQCSNTVFDESLLPNGQEEKLAKKQLEILFQRLAEKDKQLEEQSQQNQELRQEIAQTRIKNQQDQSRGYQKEDLSEYKTRKVYIDLDLEMAGWTLKQDCREEVEVTGMPNATGIGYVDYVLYADDGKPLAVVEAKKTSVAPQMGRIQAQQYANCLEQKHRHRPMIFYTNGFETYFWDDAHSTERQVSGIFTKDDLDWRAYRGNHRTSLAQHRVKDEITNRPYQKRAVKALCDSFEKGQDKALLVMATGSGKTRTSISIVDVLLRHGWIKNILFLADRRELVKQAKNAYSNLLPELSLCNLLNSKDSPESKMIFSTYPTMMNAIDKTKDKTGKRLFSPGHFDLIIIDESHRSIYKKYQDIFNYFDASLVGLTATPKDDIHKDTYALFELQKGDPTFAYTLEEAVQEDYLVPYETVESSIRIPDEGVKYDELSEEDKEEYEETFEDEEDLKDGLSPEAINKFIMNEQTIDLVIDELMTKGLKIEGGDKLGKTIIFARKKDHAEFIHDRFKIKFKSLPGFSAPIYTGIKYVDTVFDDFKEAQKLPQIAISVDMLDTGVDVPEILNLVFFKKIRSISKFKQMIGRGTRLCEDLLGPGEHKEKFRIFDYCHNFDFFRQQKKPAAESDPISLTSQLFLVKARIIKELQHLNYQDSQDYIDLRTALVRELHHQVNAIDKEHFSARMRIQFIHQFIEEAAWVTLSDTDLIHLKENIAPLISPIQEEESAKRFDLLIYSVELANLMGTASNREIKQVKETAQELAKKGTIQEIQFQREIIETLQEDSFWQNTDPIELEKVRVALRQLLKYLDKDQRKIYYTRFDDEIIETKSNGMEFGEDGLANYRKRVEYFLINKKDDRQFSIYKLRNNLKLGPKDLESLEQVLWHDIGTKEDYRNVYGDMPLATLICTVVGLDPQAANQHFSQFIDDYSLNHNQIEFINMIIRHVVQNGLMDKQLLNDQPFNRFGTIIDLFNGDREMATTLVGYIDRLNSRGEVG